MGQYKVPQNVEAEDKIIGALTLKQFIYTVVGVMIGLVSFLTLRKTPVVMLIVGVPPTALFLMLGLYQRQGQPFEALFLSIVSFMVKPRRRLWQKEPIEEVFKIEAPKVVKAVTQRDPREIRGQLESLSQIVDTRGWGNKKAELQEPGEQQLYDGESRLVEPSIAGAGELIETDVSLADDILDVANNPNAHNVNALIQDQTKNLRAEAMNKARAAAQPPAAAPSDPSQVVPVGSGNLRTDEVPAPGATYRPAPITAATTGSAAQTPAGTANLASEAHIGPGGQVSVGPTAAAPATTSDMTTNPLDGILKQAMENDDLPVSQIAAQANRASANGGLAEGRSVSLRDNGKR